MQNCPCGTGKDYNQCCGIFITGKQLPSIPEELMRSRYTAYTQANVDYIARTMKSPAADHFDPAATKSWAEQVNWVKLEVLNTSSENTRGTVEFIAHYTQKNKRFVMHEISEFQFEQGQWFYVDGKGPDKLSSLKSGGKMSRNDPCHCGSGIKFKKCCGKIS